MWTGVAANIGTTWRPMLAQKMHCRGGQRGVAGLSPGLRSPSEEHKCMGAKASTVLDGEGHQDMGASMDRRNGFNGRHACKQLTILGLLRNVTWCDR